METSAAAVVVIVNYNRRELLLAALRSLCAPQGLPFETVVVDNGSSDGSAAAVEAFAASAPFPVKILRNLENRGFCAANNQGLAASSAPFVALLNNDAEAAPGWLAALRAAFDIAPDAGMAASKILVWEDPRYIDKVGHLIYPDGQNRGRGSGQLDAGQFDAVEEVLWPDGAACMYRRAMLDEIGAFDEDLFAYGDDAELGLRARMAGWRCFYMPAARVRHHRGATLGRTSWRRIVLIERNRVLLAAKLFPGSLLWLNGAYYLARLTAGVWASLRGKGEAGTFPRLTDKLRLAAGLIWGDWTALLRLPKTFLKRRRLRPLRRLSPSQLRRLLLQHRISLRELSEGPIPR